ncbi:formate dehydrogenase subunit gamma [Magnetospirillum sulfuroxidans]|uniref:Formate dehydrogenase subunit gamma n=1 Tax=Magnetospirillum sulfuroxidans TaxID=611300 RepID=A0ABS5I7Q0_9PROT|nr:formate dehydrogenase subunit gamma [Magnetospirillum sulfuroxidans]MBR9970167.1 formate dehydrogenase subunit gamma [Magnetospirillum sulfuroxidans]
MTAAWNADRARAIIDNHRGLRGALLPILHAVQEEFGYVDAAAIPLLAEALNLSQADVHGVISFYHEFRHTRPGRHVVKICVAEACQARGSAALVDYLKTKLGIGLGETAADGSFTLEAVYCLGNCALGPSAQVDERLLGRLSPARIDGALA